MSKFGEYWGFNFFFQNTCDPCVCLRIIELPEIQLLIFVCFPFKGIAALKNISALETAELPFHKDQGVPIYMGNCL